ncbi:MAG: rhodanese-like domain-containing protein [Cocleimonas sp.]
MSSITVAELDKSIKSEHAPTIYDVRKKPAFDSDPKMIADATWQVHDQVDGWISDVPQGKQVVVYCVHGHAVSQNAAKVLCDKGIDAVYLEGGIAEWNQVNG